MQLSTCRTFDEVFERLRSGEAHAAVVPIENSLAGSVLRTYELMADADVRISGETLLPIAMNLIGRPGSRLGKIRKVHSHPVALAQCHRFLSSHPSIEAVAAYDIAAIAGETAAALYGGEILASAIQDHQDNFTRFLLIAPSGRAIDGPTPGAAGMKTTLRFCTPNMPGALFRALATFALRDINLTKLESRPIAGRPWEYTFYVDVNGAEDDEKVANALRHLREMCETVVILGSYPVPSTDDRSEMQ
jgi:prephenate dehydratase